MKYIIYLPVCSISNRYRCHLFRVVLVLYLSKYTYPFIIAMIIAFLMNPLVTFFEKKARLPRGLGCICLPITHFSFFAGLITLLVTEIISGTNYLAGVIPGHIETIVDYIETSSQPP